MTGQKKQSGEKFEAFEQALYEGLAHLNDPMYQPPPLLWQGLRVPPQQGVKALQSALIQAIETLKPTADVAPHAHGQRIYELLSLRYLQGLTQEEAGDRLGLTVRHIRREQKRAIHDLAQWLWDRNETNDAPSKAQTSAAEMEDDEADTVTCASPAGADSATAARPGRNRRHQGHDRGCAQGRWGANRKAQHSPKLRRGAGQSGGQDPSFGPTPNHIDCH